MTLILICTTIYINLLYLPALVVLMFICICKAITDNQIKDAVANGATTLSAVRKDLGVATQCCKCLPDARAVIDDALSEQLAANQAMPEPLFYSA